MKQEAGILGVAVPAYRKTRASDAGVGD